MKTLLIDIGNPENLPAFLKAVENLDFIESVKIIDQNSEAGSNVEEPAEKYNWINPTRPATEPEIDHLIEKMENSQNGITTHEVRTTLKKWMKKKAK
jgi:hypothetical protein